MLYQCQISRIILVPTHFVSIFQQNVANEDEEGGMQLPDDEFGEGVVLTNGSGAHGVEDDKEFDDWSEDTSADAVARRQQDLSSGVMGLTITVELEKTPHERQELFYNFMEVLIIKF